MSSSAPRCTRTTKPSSAKTANDPEDKPRSNAKGESYNRTYAASSRPAADFTDYAIADDAIATLEQSKARPFFLAVGFIRPHTSFVAPKSFFEVIDKTKLMLPPFYREGGEDLAALPKDSLRPNNNVFCYGAPTREEARDAGLSGFHELRGLANRPRAGKAP